MHPYGMPERWLCPFFYRTIIPNGIAKSAISPPKKIPNGIAKSAISPPKKSLTGLQNPSSLSPKNP
jgi:hypothetical protein